jgi:N-acetylmuramoyl-L-alanine amidase
MISNRVLHTISKKVMGQCLLTLSFLLFCTPLSSFQKKTTSPPYLPVKLTKNMTVAQVMKRYLLDEYECDEQQFLKINQLNKNSPLVKGKTYNLPIFLYDYNGKNIRSSTSIGDLSVAKAIQSYNVDLLKADIRTESYEANGFLYVPYHILNCLSSRKPRPKTAEKDDGDNILATEKKAGVKTRRYAIFGKNYEDVPLVSKKLKDKIFYVEGGHGGPDPGAEAKVSGRTLCEDEYAYDVSLRVARELIKQGGIVYIINRDLNDGIRDGEFLICDRDEVTYPNLKVPVHQKTRLTQRSDAINELYDMNDKRGLTDQRLIVIHVDSRGRNEQIDTFLYYQSDNDESKALAKKMKQTLESHYEGKREWKGTLSTRDLHMLRETKPTTVFVEIGNIRNEFDRKRIMIKNNRQAIASWLAEGFMK